VNPNEVEAAEESEEYEQEVDKSSREGEGSGEESARGHGGPKRLARGRPPKNS